MKYHAFLQAYKACLGLFPGRVKQRHAEQMYLTAQDMLQDVQGAAGCVRIVQLVGDLGHGLIHEHTKELGGANMNRQFKLTRQSAGNAALLGLQIVILPMLAFIGIRPLVSLVSALTARKYYYTLSIYTFGNILRQLLPLIMTGIAFRLLGKLGLGLWNRVVCSLVVGLCSAYVFYSLGMSIILQIWEVWPVLRGRLVLCLISYARWGT